MGLLERIWPSKGQMSTWIGHAVVVVLVPLVVGIAWILLDWVWPLTAAMVSGELMGAYYVFYREPRDKAAHKEKGDWRTGDNVGITPFVDETGDSLGPATAMAAYFCFWLLAMLVGAR